MSEYLYFDHAATTPVRPEVRDAMSPFLSAEAYGNPSSGHRAGREARAALDRARSQIADALGCAVGDVIFTSGGTEADNLAVLGTALRARLEGRAFRAIVARSEHKAVLDAAGAVERLGGEATLLDVDRSGQIAMDAYREALARGAAVASVMWVNNETGVIHDVVALAELARDAGVPFHTDAVQAVGKVPTDLRDTAIALASISGHKLGAPKGIGALIMRTPDLIEPLIHGGGQQGGVRPGTENVAGAVGLGEAVALAVAERRTAMEHVGDLRRLLATGLTAAVPGLGITADDAPHILHLTVPETDGSALLTHLDQAGIACSTGSACSSGSVGPSHVLVAMGTADDWQGSALRLSLAPTTTRADVDALLRRIPDIIDRVRVLTATLRGEV
jgi:cysteine desulfurase